MEHNLYHSGEQTSKNCKRVLAVALLIVVCNIWLLCRIMSSNNEQEDQYSKKAQDSAIPRTTLLGRKGYITIRDGNALGENKRSEDEGVGDDEIDVANMEEQVEVLRNSKSGEENFEMRDLEGMLLAKTEEGGKVSLIVQEGRNSSTGKEETALLTDETEFTKGTGQGDIAYRINAFHDKNGVPPDGFFYGNSTLYESEYADREELKLHVEE